MVENGRAVRLTGTHTDIDERKKIEEARVFLLECDRSATGDDFFRMLARYLAGVLEMDYVCIYRLEGDNLSARTAAVYYDGRFRENVTYTPQGTPCGDVVDRMTCCYSKEVRHHYPADALLREIQAESYVGTTLWDSRGKAIGVIAVISRRPLANCRLAESILQLVAIRAAGEFERRQTETEKAYLQSQLMQAQKMESVGRLAGGVAHDFNNMLGVILGHVEMAQELVEPAGQLFEDLDEIKKAARRSADLTRQLLAFARKQTISPRVLDLNETVEGLLKMLRRLIGENVDLVWLPGQDLGPVKIDPTQVDQILANLTVNARDAIDGIGRITIETGNAVLDEENCAEHMGSVPGSYVMLSIGDDGCGMDRTVQEHIFEPFFTTKEVGRGTGLGLATTYGIVKQNGGFIKVRSAPGQGSIFRIYLPRHVGRRSAIDSGGGAERAQKGQETILLVEDEPANLNLGKRMLEKLGYRVLAAGTPGEALRLAEHNSGEIDLLLTDVVMPEMNGRDLSNRLLSLYPGLKRLFMSGYTANVIADHGEIDEGVYFIQKPFSRLELSRKVREALGKEPAAE
jgi:signal transduction histidine kinase